MVRYRLEIYNKSIDLPVGLTVIIGERGTGRSTLALGLAKLNQLTHKDEKELTYLWQEDISRIDFSKPGNVTIIEDVQTIFGSSKPIYLKNLLRLVTMYQHKLILVCFKNNKIHYDKTKKGMIVLHITQVPELQMLVSAHIVKDKFLGTFLRRIEGKPEFLTTVNVSSNGEFGMVNNIIRIEDKKLLEDWITLYEHQEGRLRRYV